MRLQIIAVSMVLAASHIEAQPAGANYDEAKVGTYTLPDPLVFADGTPVKDKKEWRKRRREILSLFETHEYGRTPEAPRIRFKQTAEDRNALSGKATRREVRIFLTGKDDGPTMDLLIYVPNESRRPVPGFVGLNFQGNHAIHADPAIALARCWLRDARDGSVTNNRATEAGRGKEASRWQVEKVIDRGYALVTACYCDLEPDFAEGYETGIRSVLRPKKPKNLGAASQPVKGAPADAAPDEWGAIGAWAFGLSRAMDYLEKESDIDEKRVAVMGHSRLGKTALWAGAQDERFAIVISNNSGEGGASLSKRNFGETVERINTSFPHWFCGNFKKYNNNEQALPMDQHMLVALMAPRPVYIASAEEDLWADPKGEFLSAKHAEPVYRLFGLDGLGVREMPGLNQPVGKTIGYHIRSGKHDVTAYDWDRYLDFADRHFRKAK